MRTSTLIKPSLSFLSCGIVRRPSSALSQSISASSGSISSISAASSLGSARARPLAARTCQLPTLFQILNLSVSIIKIWFTFAGRFSHQSGSANIVRSRLCAALCPLHLAPGKWRCHLPDPPAVARAATARQTLSSTAALFPRSSGSRRGRALRGCHRGIPPAPPRETPLAARPGMGRRGSWPREIWPRGRGGHATPPARPSRARRRGWRWRWTRRARMSAARSARATTRPPTRSCSSTTRRRRRRRGTPPTSSRPPRTHSAHSELRFSSQFFYRIERVLRFRCILCCLTTSVVRVRVMFVIYRASYDVYYCENVYLLTREAFASPAVDAPPRSPSVYQYCIVHCI